MGKKSNIIYKKLFGIRKQPQLIKGSNVGYEITELKKTSTKELKTILNLIILYFTGKTHQKIQNLNFKKLYLRIKNELELREKKENKFKVKFQIEKEKKKIKLTQIEEVIIPNFFNDKPLIQNINSNNIITYNSFLSTSVEEENINDCEKIKYNELLFQKKNLDFEKENEPDINYFFSSTKNNDFNYDFEPNLIGNYYNYFNNHLFINEKEENLFFPKI